MYAFSGYLNGVRSGLSQYSPHEVIAPLWYNYHVWGLTVKEAINIALRSLYARDDKPDIPRTTMKRLIELAVTNVHLKCNKSWFCQKDGLAMGAPLAVILDNLWMKSWEPQLKLRILFYIYTECLYFSV